MKLTALLLLLLPLSAQEPDALAVRNVSLDSKKTTLDFDVVNQAARPVHAWLATITVAQAKGWTGTSRVTPENCVSAGATPLAPGQSRHCRADVDFGQGDAARNEPAVHVDAVLFEDGTAEGDLRMLDTQIDEVGARLRVLQEWQRRFEEERKALGPADLVRSFSKTLAGADSSIPPAILYSSAAMNEREIVESFASSIVQDGRKRGMSADALVKQLDGMLQQRVQSALERSRMFPARDKPYAPPAAVAAAPPITNRTSRFRIVSAEERDQRLRLVLRNDYDKEIVAWAITQRQPDGTSMRARDYLDSAPGQAVPPGGLAEFAYGAVPEGGPLELACVIFRDGGADGDEAITRKLRDGWAGHQAEKGRILPLLCAIANLPEADVAAAARNLISDLQARKQEEPGAEHSIDFVLGEQAERKAVIRDLQETRQDRKGLAGFLSRYEAGPRP